MKVPSSIVKENQYTVQNEFVFADSYISYKGYYFILNNRYFAGKTYKSGAPELIKIDSDRYDPLRANTSTNVYSLLNNNNISKIYNKIPSIFFNSMVSQKVFLAKQLNTYPIRIFFTNEQTYLKESNNPLYSFTTLDYDAAYGFSITEDNIRQIPEIKIFLAEYSNIDLEE